MSTKPPNSMKASYLLASSALEAFRFGFLFASSQGLEKVLLLYFLVCRPSFLRRHFLEQISFKNKSHDPWRTSLVILLNLSVERSPLTMFSRRLGLPLSLRLTYEERILPLYAALAMPNCAKIAASTAFARLMIRSLAVFRVNESQIVKLKSGIDSRAPESQARPS